MFRNYNIITTDNDENSTENWSYPAGFQRFNSANVPKSRLGKRKTINPSAEVKRSILNGISLNSRVINKYDCTSKTSSLTHPLNSTVTPNYKKIRNPSDINCEAANDNTDYAIKNGPPTYFRKVDSNPLREVNNFLHNQKISFSSCKPSIHQQQEQQQSDITKNFNKTFEDEKIGSPTEDCSQSNSFSSNIDATHSDSSDMCDNSSFMTAHDIYNLEKNRSTHEFIKTPGKGYGLFDTFHRDVDSPLDALSNQTDEDNDSFHNLLVKTPRLICYDSLDTPYRSKTRNDFYTPFKTNRTPASDRHLEGVSEKEIEDELLNDNTQNSLQKLEDDIKDKCIIVSQNNLPLKDNEKEKPADKSVNLKVDLIHLDATNINKKIPTTDVRKQSVKRQIFEGLGWTLQPASFSIKSPIIEVPSDLIKNAPCTSNPESANFSNLADPILHKVEPEISPKLDVFDKPLIKNNIAKSIIGSKSLELFCRRESGESSKSLSSSITSVFDVARDERLSFEMDKPSPIKSLDISEDPNRHNLPICDEISDVNSLSSCSTYPSKSLKMVTDEANVSATSFQQSFTLNNTEVSLLKNTSPNKKDSTILLRSLDSHLKEEMPGKTDITNTAEHDNVKTTDKFDDTVILKPPLVQNIEQKPVVRCHEKIQPKQQISNKECLVNDVPIFGCQRQIIMPPQTNIIYVNNKPLTVLSMLGKGGSSEVYQVLEANSSKLMALKFVNLSSVEETVAKGYLNEIEVLAKLQGCPSVIKMFDNEYISSNKILYVLMEKGDTDFSRLMKDIMKTKKISMPMIIYYWTEMLNAVKDIHDRGIIHSDLKPANFLLVSGRLKLIDFGIASSLQGDMTSVLKDVTTGTFNYMSPEAIRNSGETRGYKINYKSDIWSLGCILYNLLYGRTPFSHLSNTWAKLQAIADPETSVSFPTGSTAPPNLLLSVRWALLKDPKQRPTAEELLRLAELTPGPETRLGRQISSLFGEYIYQMFPNCRVRFEAENPKDLKQTNNNPLH